eukprot:Skav206406  [mRNA]  locus=scaffold2210:142834:153129:+ [translate_table: standard]
MEAPLAPLEATEAEAPGYGPMAGMALADAVLVEDSLRWEKRKLSSVVLRSRRTGRSANGGPGSLTNGGGAGANPQDPPEAPKGSQSEGRYRGLEGNLRMKRREGTRPAAKKKAALKSSPGGWIHRLGGSCLELKGGCRPPGRVQSEVARLDTADTGRSTGSSDRGNGHRIYKELGSNTEEEEEEDDEVEAVPQGHEAETDVDEEVTLLNSTISTGGDPRCHLEQDIADALEAVGMEKVDPCVFQEIHGSGWQEVLMKKAGKRIRSFKEAAKNVGKEEVWAAAKEGKEALKRAWTLSDAGAVMGEVSAEVITDFTDVVLSNTPLLGCVYTFFKKVLARLQGRGEVEGSFSEKQLAQIREIVEAVVESALKSFGSDLMSQKLSGFSAQLAEVAGLLESADSDAIDKEVDAMSLESLLTTDSDKNFQWKFQKVGGEEAIERYEIVNVNEGKTRLDRQPRQRRRWRERERARQMHWGLIPYYTTAGNVTLIWHEGEGGGLYSQRNMREKILAAGHKWATEKIGKKLEPENDKYHWLLIPTKGLTAEKIESLRGKFGHATKKRRKSLFGTSKAKVQKTDEHKNGQSSRVEENKEGQSGKVKENKEGQSSKVEENKKGQSGKIEEKGNPNDNKTKKKSWWRRG